MEDCPFFIVLKCKTVMTCTYEKLCAFMSYTLNSKDEYSITINKFSSTPKNTQRKFTFAKQIGKQIKVGRREPKIVGREP